MFGIEVVNQLMRLIKMWDRLGFSSEDKVYLGAIDTLMAYRTFLLHTNLDSSDLVCSRLDEFFRKRAINLETVPTTPIEYKGESLDLKISSTVLEDVFLARRSLRDFDANRTVPSEIIEWAVNMAQMSPSACNRQPCKVYELLSEEKKRAALKFQNGNLGFWTSGSSCFNHYLRYDELFLTLRSDFNHMLTVACFR
jgi:hypothetical protein